MNSRILLPFLLFTAASASAAAPDRIVLPDDVVPVHYDVTVVPDATALSFMGSVDIQLDVRKATRTIVLNARVLFAAVKSLTWNVSPSAVRLPSSV